MVKRGIWETGPQAGRGPGLLLCFNGKLLQFEPVPHPHAPALYFSSPVHTQPAALQSPFPACLVWLSPFIALGVVRFRPISPIGCL